MSSQGTEHIDAELGLLLEQRSNLLVALKSNADLQETVTEAVERHIPKALAELDHVEELLQLAAEMHDSDAANVTLHRLPSSHDQMAAMPVLPAQFLARDDHTRRMADEVNELRTMLSHSSWSRSETLALRNAVLAECKRIAAYEFMQKRAPDPLSQVARMSDGTIENEYGRHPDIDWDAIKTTLPVDGRTSDECRTQWLEGPRRELDDDEVKDLRSAIETADSHSRFDWAAMVARSVNVERTGERDSTGRTTKGDSAPVRPWQLFAAWRAHIAANPATTYAHPHEPTSEIDEELLRLASVWGLDWHLLAEKMQRGTQAIKHRFVNVLQPTVALGRWSEEELERLKSACQGAHAEFDWLTIASAVGSRTAAQCKIKWSQYAGDPASKQNGQPSERDARFWTNAEDEELTAAVSEDAALHGAGVKGKWDRIASRLGKARTARGCKDHWAAMQRATKRQVE